MSLPSPAEDAEESAVDTFVGCVLELRYRVEEKLGEGGLGTVYRAQHLKLARRVAIKVLRDDLRGIPQIRARFEREVKALSSLSHPNVVTITDFGISDGIPFLVMELAEGIELAKMVGEPLPPARALSIIRQILASLAYAHERDVVHRDLKPANVIVRMLPDGRDHVTVLDFGLAKFVGDDAGADLTRSGLVVGTPAYMPPEQMAAGARKADARSDLYAAGLIMFELLAGRRPFQFEEPADLLRAHLVMQPPSLAEALSAGWVDPRVESILTRALAKAPDERFQSAKEMIDAIDALPADGLVRGGTGPRDGRKDSTRPARPTPISAEARASRSRTAERARSMGTG
ncbi:MAG: serine/threonine protein kinase, partial [Myxococcota bacterium]|nr:serine/threonine protein kinase [Myxococcota bacterium]